MQSLATKVRPSSFAEVVGQNAIVSILSRQVFTKTFKHSYLFCGCSGSGKTTVARIFAKEINNGEGEPIEIDAATNNGVDSIRMLNAEVQQMPIDCNYKVVVIDECHQLSKSAWDASLKLIEEPPEHAVFIFCTTNPSKIPETILSRLQRFDFKRISTDVMADRLEYILQENLHNSEYDRDALHRIAMISKGNVRDAVQILEKCLDASDSITVECVESVCGVCSIELMADLVENMYDKNIDMCVDVLKKLKESSPSMKNAFESLIEFSVDCALYAKVNDIYKTDLPKSLADKLPKDYARVKTFVDRLMELYKYADESNSLVFLKTVCMEMCDE